MSCEPFIIVISAPSGAGKTTIAKAVSERLKNVEYSISCTTRKKRDNEIDGRDYYFLDRPTFEKRINQGKLYEWAEVYGDLYGTPKESVLDFLKQGKSVLMDIDIQGAQKIKKIYPNGVFIFILPPSIKELEKRLLKRGKDSPDIIKTRLKSAEQEMKHRKEFDYLIINKNLDSTVEMVESIIKVEQCKTKRM